MGLSVFTVNSSDFCGQGSFDEGFRSKVQNARQENFYSDCSIASGAMMSLPIHPLCYPNASVVYVQGYISPTIQRAREVRY